MQVMVNDMSLASLFCCGSSQLEHSVTQLVGTHLQPTKRSLPLPPPLPLFKMVPLLFPSPSSPDCAIHTPVGEYTL